jgi:hypothetical protein
MTYATEQLVEDVAYVAYHLHWSLDSLLDLDHRFRQRVIEAVAELEQRARTGG